MLIISEEKGEIEQEILMLKKRLNGIELDVYDYEDIFKKYNIKIDSPIHQK